MSGQGRRFATLAQVLGAVAQSGSAPRSHRGGYVFKSPQLHREVLTFLWGLFSRLGLTFPVGLWFLVRCGLCRVQGMPGWLLCVLAACLRACLRCWVVVTVPGFACVAGYGGAVVRSCRVVRRRLRVFGGSPAAARRALSSCRAFQACRMRWLRTMSSVVVSSMRGVRPMRRHQPRLMSLVAGSLAVAKPRSAPVRRA